MHFCHTFCKTPPLLHTSMVSNSTCELTVHEHHNVCSHQNDIVPVMVKESPSGKHQHFLTHLCIRQDIITDASLLGWGSLYGQPYSSRQLDISRVQNTHQCSQAVRCLKGLQNLSPVHSRLPCPDNVRHHHNCLLHQLTGRSEILSPVCRSGQFVELVHQ